MRIALSKKDAVKNLKRCGEKSKKMQRIVDSGELIVDSSQAFYLPKNIRLFR
jgi:hypothetical protein